ncbi:hypothetical protein SERLA73DRAFT_157503 [Serpula lacrymans var. lacrymans S7.3]|uniref:Alpha-type protein kinase domain-containing protein n=1 Tax=Serpula lacrymans var. lacrymans (strain S7.3) TaxID=936435 RepID=F8QJC7_SERL3|nr:hypothetical protein SERLA73DRAFT_157503 [Serpula lacrymans var. lacrymans S7.3]
MLPVALTCSEVQCTAIESLRMEWIDWTILEGVAQPEVNDVGFEDDKLEEDELDEDELDKDKGGKKKFLAPDKEELKVATLWRNNSTLGFCAITNSMSSGRKLLAFKDELAKMLVEANCMYWGTSLMSIVYQFIASCPVCNKDPSELPPPEIPCLCMVQFAIVVPIKPSLKSAVYLLEKKIGGKFVKYINNNSAAPWAWLNNDKLLIAKFLCFAQYVQYNLSHGLIFLSDFQGAGFLLTDCQAITTEKYAACFEEGNWTGILYNFP